ncbi:MAG: hypothetical protein R3B06_27455 [Kofleriaceae bacterium]
MFVDRGVAARIEAGEAALARQVADGVAATGRPVLIDRVAGGLAVLARPGCPTNKVAGCGFGEPLEEDALAAIEARWWARAEPVRFELATVAAPGLHQALAARGYRLDGYEVVLVRSIGAAGVEAGADPAITVERVTAATAAAWVDASIDGFGHPDGASPVEAAIDRAALAPIMEDLGGSGLPAYLARVDGVVAGAASARLADGVLQLCGASTVPAFRRRGVQRALLRARLADARAAGCDLAVVTTAPMSQSQANVMAAGFAVAYARAVLVRSAPG